MSTHFSKALLIRLLTLHTDENPLDKDLRFFLDNLEVIRGLRKGDYKVSLNSNDLPVRVRSRSFSSPEWHALFEHFVEEEDDFNELNFPLEADDDRPVVEYSFNKPVTGRSALRFLSKQGYELAGNRAVGKHLSGNFSRIGECTFIGGTRWFDPEDSDKGSLIPAFELWQGRARVALNWVECSPASLSEFNPRSWEKVIWLVQKKAVK